MRSIKLIFSLVFVLFGFMALPGQAQTFHAVLPPAACANNGNGANWNCAASTGAAGAFIGTPASMVRGDVYCYADGNYGNKLTLNQANSGSTSIELRKGQSTISDSCTALTGWNGATMGSSQALWQSTGSGQIVSITTDNWLINGNGGNAGTTEVGCGGVQANPPSSMTGAAPNPNKCGFKIDNSTCTSTATDGCDGGSGVMKSTGANIVWKSDEWFGQGLNSNGNNNSETYFWFASGGNLTTTSMSHMYMHNASTTYFTIVSGGENGGTFDHNYVWGVHDGSVNHGEAIQLQGNNSNFSVFNNIFRDQQTNGDMVGVATGTQTNFSFYNNVDFCSAGGTSTTCRHNDGFLGCFQSGNNCVATTWNVYNNTLSYPGNCGTVINSGTGLVVENNIFYNCSSAGLGGGGTYTQDYNSYLNSHQSAVGAHDVSNAAAPNPFVNLPVGNANLASDNALWNNRLSLGSPYNVDIYGTTYTTDRGAAQFVSAGASFNVSPTTVPANHSNSITLTITGTGLTPSATFSVAGVTGAVLSSCTNTATSGSCSLVTGSGTGTATITDTTDSVSTTITIATATLVISPSAGNTGTTPTLTMTGTNTLWSTETPAGLFSVSGAGCTSDSIGTPTVTTNTAATVTLTTGSTTCTITITDTSTTATASFTVAVPTTPTVTSGTSGSITATSAIISGNSYVCTGACSSVTSEGTCYAVTANPTSPCTSDGTASPWASAISSLGANTTYHFRAFAINAAGTAYGTDSTFITSTLGIVPQSGGCTKIVTLTGSSPSATVTCTPISAGDAITFNTECHPVSGTISGITLTAAGWTINQIIAPHTTGSNSWMASWGAIAPNTASVTFSLTFTGGADCTNYGIWNSREVTGNDPTGGATTFNANGVSAGAASTCNQAGAAITPPLNNEFIDVFCVLGSATTASAPWTLGQTDGFGNSEEYQLMSGGAGTGQTPAYNGSSGAFDVQGIAIAPFNFNQIAPAPNFAMYSDFQHLFNGGD